MQLLELTLPTAAQNVALDEALLDQADATDSPSEVLRIWEPSSPMVVIGRASRVDEEVNRAACRAREVPILRRTSGGAAIVSDRGCLMYAVVLSYHVRPQLRIIREAHRFVLERMAHALASRVSYDVQVAGTSDLAMRVAGNDHDRRKLQKFSGNSVRCRRDHLLYHGTVLYDFSLPLAGEYLSLPPRQPEYRAGRSHRTFIANLPIAGDVLRRTIIEAWQPDGTRDEWPVELTSRLVDEKYSTAEWNFRF